MVSNQPMRVTDDRNGAMGVHSGYIARWDIVVTFCILSYETNRKNLAFSVERGNHKNEGFRVSERS
jgi:hypothetical protein